MAKPGRIERCMGRVEFRAAEEEILHMHRMGYANKHIYAKLAEEGKLSLAYSTFNGHLRKLLQAKSPTHPDKKPTLIVDKEASMVFTIPSNGNI
ncbi:TraK family protein [Solidesulfovibrio fructosivorans]|uniref:TraK family protein n=1 Tax=Solidesulfovibrio fructosivorans TaxID=878 RepID=UPI0013052BC3|nr:TraK family protein [Solidesulfovibrio fructosivorans]